MRKFTNYFAMAALALTFTLGMSGCSSSNDDPEPAPAYELKLMNEKDAALDVDPDALTEQIIKIETTASKSDLLIQKVNDQTWCTATVKSETEIAVTAGANTASADREAKFKLVAGASSVEFSITQAGVNPKDVTLSIESSDLTDTGYGFMLMDTENKQNTITVKVNTNASRWTAEATDYSEEGIPSWVHITNARGKNGENMTFYLEANMDMTRNATITIHAGDETVDIMINQMAMSGATSFKLFTDEKKANAFANKTALNFKAAFDKDDTTEHIKTFYVTTDGGYVTLVCKSGTEDEVDAKDAWLTAGGNLESLRISATSNTTGAERKLDVVIEDSDNWNELFRIPVTQAAK